MVKELPESIKESPSIKSPVKKINFKLIGIIAVILIILLSIPVGVFLVRQRQEIRKRAVVLPPKPAKTLYLPMYSKKFQDLLGSTMVQNTGGTATNITFNVYGVDGNLVFTRTVENVSPKGFRVFYAPSDTSGLEDGLYTAIITSNNTDIAAIATHGRSELSEWADIYYFGYHAYNALAGGSKTLYLPFYTKNYNQLIGSTMIQNIGDQETHVTARFNDPYGAEQASKTITIPAKGFGVLFSKTDIPDLSDGLYTAILTSDNSDIVAMITNGRHPAPEVPYGGYSAYSAPFDTAKTLYLPMYSKKFQDLLGSTMVQNTGETATDITLKVYDVNGSQVFTKTESNVSPRGFRVFNAPTLLNTLPDDFLGTVIITSSDTDIAAIATHGRSDLSEWADIYYSGYHAYEALARGSKTVYLPFYTKNYNHHIGSTIIQNIGTEETTVTARFYDDFGAEQASKTITIAPKGFGVIFSKTDISELPDNFLGSVILTSDKSDIIAMVTNGIPSLSNINYSGYSAYTAFSPEVTPTPTLTPTPTVTPTPTPTPILECQHLKVYNQNWEEITNFSTISVGNKVYFLVEGSCTELQGITNAKFRINNGDWLEPTDKKWGHFYREYTIPSGGSYKIEAMVYNPNLGWR